MPSISYRLLKSQSEFEEFASKSCALVGNAVPVPYFQAGRVVGAFLDGEMIGGWALSNPASVTLRCYKVLPAGSTQQQELSHLCDQRLVSELTQVWLTSKVASPVQSVRFWRHLAKDMLENSNKNILFGFRSTNAGLHNLYQYLDPRILYAGPVSGGPDVKTHAQVTIMLIKRSSFRFLTLRFAPNILRRFFRKTRGVHGVALKVHEHGGSSLENPQFEPNSR